LKKEPPLSTVTVYQRLPLKERGEKLVKMSDFKSSNLKNQKVFGDCNDDYNGDFDGDWTWSTYLTVFGHPDLLGLLGGCSKL